VIESTSLALEAAIEHLGLSTAALTPLVLTGVVAVTSTSSTLASRSARGAGVLLISTSGPTAAMAPPSLPRSGRRYKWKTPMTWGGRGVGARGVRDVMSSRDREQTLAAIRVRAWRVVLLGKRAKRVHTKTWQITDDVGRAAAHLDGGGNLGLLAHETNGLAVLDPDVLLPWADMIETLGQPAAAWTLTGRGRLHYYVAWEPDLPAKIEWNGQVIGEIQRGPGLQQIVMPPSLHPDTGRHYEWLVDPVTQPLEPLPGPWRAYLRGLTYARRYR